MIDSEMEMDGPGDRYKPPYPMRHQLHENNDYDRFQQNQEQSFHIARDAKDAFLPMDNRKRSSNSRGSRNSREASFNRMGQSLNNSGAHSGSHRRRTSGSNGSKGSRGMASGHAQGAMLSGFSNYNMPQHQ